MLPFKSYQSLVLRQINGLESKEEVLSLVGQAHDRLDAINLVTCLYKLSRMLITLDGSPEQRAVWRSDVLSSQAYGNLLRVNARCLSNLIWSLVKIEESAMGADSMARQVVQCASPLVLHFMKDCSGQGLANLLWGYSKLPFVCKTVLVGLVSRMVQLLEHPATAKTMDPQALANSIWAIAHMRCLPQSLAFAELEQSEAWQVKVSMFLLRVSDAVMGLLTHIVNASPPSRGFDRAGPEPFPAQALVKVAWSYSSLLGTGCSTDASVRALLTYIKHITSAKLLANLILVQQQQQQGEPWLEHITGQLSGQALVQLVSAYEKAGLLDAELLQVLLDVVMHRITAGTGPNHRARQDMQPGFKPRELCLILKACASMNEGSPQGGGVDAGPLLVLLPQLLTTMQQGHHAWSEADVTDVKQAMQQLLSFSPTATSSLPSASTPTWARSVPEQGAAASSMMQQGQQQALHGGNWTAQHVAILAAAQQQQLVPVPGGAPMSPMRQQQHGMQDMNAPLLCSTGGSSHLNSLDLTWLTTGGHWEPDTADGMADGHTMLMHTVGAAPVYGLPSTARYGLDGAVMAAAACRLQLPMQPAMATAPVLLPSDLLLSSLANLTCDSM